LKRILAVMPDGVNAVSTQRTVFMNYNQPSSVIKAVNPTASIFLYGDTVPKIKHSIATRVVAANFNESLD
jgi:hypothetical protein